MQPLYYPFEVSPISPTSQIQLAKEFAEFRVVQQIHINDHPWLQRAAATGFLHH